MEHVWGMGKCSTGLGRGSHSFDAFHAAAGTRVSSEPAPLYVSFLRYSGVPFGESMLRIGSGLAHPEERQQHWRARQQHGLQRLDFPVKVHIATKASNGVTTLMIRNLPRLVKLRDLVKEMDESGFAGRYDFVYCPRSFGDRQHQGHAFVNFHSPIGASSFADEWHKSQRFGMYGKIKLNVTSAELQGFHANVAKWGKAMQKADRIRSEACRPLILRELGAQAAAGSASAPSSPSTCLREDANSSGS